MKNVHKITTGLLAVVLVFLSVSFAGAQTQSGNQAQPSKTKMEAPASQQSQVSLADQMKNFTPDPANPELSAARYALLKARYCLDSGSEIKLNANELAAIRESLPALEKKVASLESMNKTNSTK